MNIKEYIINFNSLLHIFFFLGVSNHKVKAFPSTLQRSSRSITGTSTRRQQRQFQGSRNSKNHDQTSAYHQKIIAKQQLLLLPDQIKTCDDEERDEDTSGGRNINPTKKITRRSLIETTVGTLLSSSSLLGVGVLFAVPTSSCAKVPPPGTNKRKCADIDSCRELGDAKIVNDEILNPTYKLPNGVRYKVLPSNISPTSTTTTNTTSKNAVQDNSVVDMIYSISTAGGQYMYSQGFGYEKVDVFQGDSNGSNSNKPKNDLGLDSIRVVMGRHDVPVGVEEALLGMKRGERRRVNVPSGVVVGFESSDWRPEPKSNSGKLAVRAYRKVLEGNGNSQPPFPISTVWDVEVLGIRK